MIHSPDPESQIDFRNFDKALNPKSLQHSAHIDAISAAFAKAQGQFQKIALNKKVAFKGRSYSYADLQEIQSKTYPALHKNEIAVIQSPDYGEKKLTVITRLVHSSGQWIEIKMSGPVDFTNQANHIQALGSATTYLRRYSLMSILGVVGDEDTDASDVETEKPKQAVKKQGTNDDAKIIESERRNLFYYGRGMSRDEIKSFLKENYGIESTKEIKRKDFKGICKALSDHAQKSSSGKSA